MDISDKGPGRPGLADEPTKPVRPARLEPEVGDFESKLRFPPTLSPDCDCEIKPRAILICFHAGISSLALVFEVEGAGDIEAHDVAEEAGLKEEGIMETGLVSSSKTLSSPPLPGLEKIGQSGAMDRSSILPSPVSSGQRICLGLASIAFSGTDIPANKFFRRTLFGETFWRMGEWACRPTDTRRGDGAARDTGKRC